MKKIILPLLLALFLFQITSCSDKDTLEDVTVNFTSPTDGQEIDLANTEEFEFNITVSADKDLHDIFFRVFPTNDPSDRIVDIKRHRHDTEIEIVQIRDLSSYSSGTEFTVEIEVCVDHDCSAAPVQESITFSVV